MSTPDHSFKNHFVAENFRENSSRIEKFQKKSVPKDGTKLG